MGDKRTGAIAVGATVPEAEPAAAAPVGEPGCDPERGPPPCVPPCGGTGVGGGAVGAIVERPAHSSSDCMSTIAASSEAEGSIAILS